jgi:hypothetical protein
MLLAVWLLEERDAPLAAGLAFAAALNCKIIPLLLAPVLIASLRDRRALWRFGAGLLLGLTPFLFPLFGARGWFLKDVFGYTPNPEAWGVAAFAQGAQSTARLAQGGRDFLAWYQQSYRPVLALPILALALHDWLYRSWDLYQASLLSLLVGARLLTGTPGAVRDQ